MTLELNKPYLVKRVASKDGVLHYLPLEAICDGITIGKPQLAKRVALKDGVLHYLMSDQKLDETTGKLIIGKPYFAKRVKQNADGTLHYVVSGKQCEEDPTVEVCGVDECCAMEAMVSVSTDDVTYSDPVQADLTCGGTYEYASGWYCYNEETEEQIPVSGTETILEKDTLASPEPYDTGFTSGTRSTKSVIWSGDEFEIDGDFYRLFYWKVETHVYQTSPTVVTTDDCFEGWVLLKKMTSGSVYDEFGTWWETFAGTHLIVVLAATGMLWTFNYDSSNPHEPELCPEGYNWNGDGIVMDDIGDGYADIDFIDPCEG